MLSQTYRSIEVYRLWYIFRTYLRFLVRVGEFCNNLTDESDLNVDGRNSGNGFRIITLELGSKFQLTIGVFSIAFAMLLIEKLTEFPKTPTQVSPDRNDQRLLVSSERHRQCGVKEIAKVAKWCHWDSNTRPLDRQSHALTTEPPRPTVFHTL